MRSCAPGCLPRPRTPAVAGDPVVVPSGNGTRNSSPGSYIGTLPDLSCSTRSRSSGCTQARNAWYVPPKEPGARPWISASVSDHSRAPVATFQLPVPMRAAESAIESCRRASTTASWALRLSVTSRVKQRVHEPAVLPAHVRLIWTCRTLPSFSAAAPVLAHRLPALSRRRMSLIASRSTWKSGCSADVILPGVPRIRSSRGWPENRAVGSRSAARPAHADKVGQPSRSFSSADCASSRWRRAVQHHRALPDHAGENDDDGEREDGRAEAGRSSGPLTIEAHGSGQQGHQDDHRKSRRAIIPPGRAAQRGHDSRPSGRRRARNPARET